jgi:tRNA G10  N-methylase Trm11
MEAAMLGCQVAGSDLDTEAVAGSHHNLNWLSESYNLEIKSTLFPADVTAVKRQQLPQVVNAIVTEPFLGKQTPQPAQLPNVFKGLEKMYWGAFKNWTQLLANQATLVVVFPFVQVGKKTFSLESLIDKIAPLGYTIKSEPVLYHRPQAVVQRQIQVITFVRK